MVNCIPSSLVLETRRTISLDECSKMPTKADDVKPFTTSDRWRTITVVMDEDGALHFKQTNFDLGGKARRRSAATPTFLQFTFFGHTLVILLSRRDQAKNLSPLTN
jgi:hypothetical protein